MKIEFEIDAEEVRDTIEECSGLILSDKQVEDILRRNKSMACNIFEWGVGTEEREKIVDLACKSIGVKKHWPCYGDPPEYKDEFYKDLTKAAIKNDVAYITSEQKE